MIRSCFSTSNSVKRCEQFVRRASTNVSRISRRDEDYSRWYRDVIAAADLIDASPVRGCMIMKPYGYAIWELLQQELDRRIKSTGVQNAYFPLLMPISYFTKEAEHVEGFAKECAVVTHHRLTTSDSGLEPDREAKLTEPLVVRPTSEAVIWNSFGRWIHSHADLPVLINQWANVCRWEMRTRPFLRTSEFLWQEGHTAHSSADEALDRAKRMLRIYEATVQEILGVAVIPGIKSKMERFAGAEMTYTIEAMMQNGWALQSGTSHFLGQNFSKAFDVTHLDPNGKHQHVWGTSWGASTRLLGALIMSHSDDIGLVLPPKVAPIQVVVVPLAPKAKANTESSVGISDLLQAANSTVQRLREAGIRAHLDDRTNIRPGPRFFEWERKGVPLRLEIGEREYKSNMITGKSRSSGSKHQFTLDDSLEAKVHNTLAAIQDGLLEQSQERQRKATLTPATYSEMKDMVISQQNSTSTDPEDDMSFGERFYEVPWCEDTENEMKVKDETKLTLRCYPLDAQHKARGQKCIISGKSATEWAIFARAF